MKRISVEEMIAIRISAYQDKDRYKYAGNCIVTAAQRQLEFCEKERKAEIRELYKELEDKYSEALILGKPLEEHSWYRRLKSKHIKGE